MHHNKPHPGAIAITLVLLATGCDRRDERLTQLAQRNAELQARQNQEMSDLNREVANGTRRLVEANAASADKLLAMQSELQRQHDKLETERRALALERNRESILVPAITSLGAVLVALLPLLICWRLLMQVRDEPPETELSGLLLEELMSSESSLPALPSVPSAPTALPTSSGSSDASSLDHPAG